MWRTTPRICTEQRLKANLRSTDWAAEQIGWILIAWPHILDSVPKMNVRGALHIAFHKFCFSPEPDWEARGGLLNTCCVQLLRPCTTSVLRSCSGVSCAQARRAYVCVNAPCVSSPSSLPISDPVMVAVWKLKRQGAAYESVDHLFPLPCLLPFAIWVSKPAGTVPVRVHVSWPTLLSIVLVSWPWPSAETWLGHGSYEVPPTSTFWLWWFGIFNLMYLFPLFKTKQFLAHWKKKKSQTFCAFLRQHCIPGCILGLNMEIPVLALLYLECH